MDEPIYTISQIAAAAGVPANTVRAWHQRGHYWLSQQDKAAEGSGLPHLLSMRSALRLGAMNALVGLGVHPKTAGQAANHWTLHGHGVVPGFHKFPRYPGELYPEPFTVLCVYPGGEPQVKHMPRGADAVELFIDGRGINPGATFLILDYVDKAIRTALDAVEPGKVRSYSRRAKVVA